MAEIQSRALFFFQQTSRDNQICQFEAAPKTTEKCCHIVYVITVSYKPKYFPADMLTQLVHQEKTFAIN